MTQAPKLFGLFHLAPPPSDPPVDQTDERSAGPPNNSSDAPAQGPAACPSECPRTPHRQRLLTSQRLMDALLAAASPSRSAVEANSAIVP